MTEQERINNETALKFAVQDAKFAAFMEEAKQQREEMRRLQERQDKMQEQHNADMKAAQVKHNADMKELREDIKNSLKHIQSLTIASMAGIVAIAVGVLGFLWSTARNMEPPPTPPAQTAQAAPQVPAQ